MEGACVSDFAPATARRGLMEGGGGEAGVEGAAQWSRRYGEK